MEVLLISITSIVITSSTFVFPTAILSFVSDIPFLKNMLVVAAAEIRRSCMDCLVDGCCRTAQRLLTADPTFPATSETFSFASLVTSSTNAPAECPAPLSLTPIYQHWTGPVTRMFTKKIQNQLRIPEDWMKSLAFSCHRGDVGDDGIWCIQKSPENKT